MVRYSVVIPTYNNQTHLSHSLESLVMQQHYTRDRYEVLVVDDGSFYPLADTVSAYQDRLNVQTIRLERDSRSSRSRARNCGWHKAVGEFVVFIDSDIVVKPDHLAQLDRYFNVQADAVVIGNRVHHPGPLRASDIASGTLWTYLDSMRHDVSVLDYRYLTFSSQSFNGQAVPDVWLHAYSCNLALPRFRLLEGGGFDENFLQWGLEDIELAYRLHCKNVPIHVNPYLEVIHQHSGHRDDVNISQERMSGYLSNIHYFLHLHPQALVHYADPISILTRGHDYQVPRARDNDLCIEIFETETSFGHIRAILAENNRNFERIFVFDYTDCSNLDIYVQCMPQRGYAIYYFPISKTIDVEVMKAYISNVRYAGTSRA